MGRTLESMSIHSPTLPKKSVSKTAESLNELLDEKAILEGTLSQLNNILQSHDVSTTALLETTKLMVDMSTPLIDQNGFPRADIDVVQSMTLF